MKLRSPTFAFWRPSPAIAAAIAIMLLIAGALVVLYGKRSYETQKANEASVQARILASTVSAALFFNDQEAAQAYVNALSANPELQAALLYDAGGALFVGYSRGTAQAPPVTAANGEPRIEGDSLVVTAPVIQDAKRIGTITLQTSIGSVARRLSPFVVIALLAALAAMVIAVLGSTQTALTKANAELGTRAAELAAANDSLQILIKEREKAEQALRQAQKMEAIGQLTAGVAHDFNNLLTAVIGRLELIQGNPGDPARVMRLGKDAIEAAERGARLIEQLLMFARRRPMHPQTVNPNRLIAESEALLRSATEGNVDLVVNLSSTLDPARIDPTQFDSAVLNLVVNAREAISGAGRIIIETRNVEFSAEEVADDPDIAPGRYVLVTVSDTGRGIGPDILPRVFDPFFTTKGVGEGSGIGLSQVYGFAKESGGCVKIRSEVGVGTTVSLYLPHSTEHELAAVPKSRAIPLQQRSADETVLVVEDERIVLAAAIETIRGLGYRVVWAVNAGKALEILKSEEPVDILFSDVVMPGEMNGIQLAAVAARLRPTVKILLASGYAATALRTEHGLGQEVPLLQKPYHAHELAKQLRRLTSPT